MQFTAVTLFALVAAVVANPIGRLPFMGSSSTGDIFEQDRFTDRFFLIAPRQQAAEANEVTVEAPAMTDSNGNIVPFDAETVAQPNLAAGL